MFVSPEDGPRWVCERHHRALTYRDMQQGCGDHLYIPELVPGEQEDADPASGTVTYRMPDGSAWVNGESKGRAA